VKLKGELHRVIGLCTLLSFLGLGLISAFQVRRFHREEYVQARGEAMADILSVAATRALQGPNPEADLQRLLGSLVKDEEKDQVGVDVVSAVVYDPEGGLVGTPVGGLSREHSPEDPHIVKAQKASKGQVLVEPGEVLGRFAKDGEEIVEFALPLVDEGGAHLGVLVFSIARQGAQAAYLRQILFMFLGGALTIGLLWAALYRLLNDLILKPILELSSGIKQVRGGDLTARVGIYRRDEIGTLVESFNDLIAVLVERDSLQARLEEANRLAEAHRRLNEAHRQLKEAQEQLILTEKHASLGRLVHGLNHELNNPLSAAQNMIPPLRTALASLKESLDPPPPPEPEESEIPSGSGSGSDTTVNEGSDSKDASTEAPALDEVPEAEPGSDSTPDLESDSNEGETSLPDAPAEVAAPAESDSAAAEAAGSPEPETAVPEPTEPTPPPPPPIPEEVLEDLEDAVQAVDVLGRSVKRAINIVRDLGEFSRLTTADLEQVELKAVVDEALSACEGELGEGKVSVSVEIPEVEGEPLRLKAFPHLLAQVFVNLITNSAQAMGGSGRIRIWAKRAGDGRVVIELDDNGPGIPKENLPKVFEPFFTTKEQGRGTGLGLSICLGVVEKHGGTIEARRRWRGAHFVIELPLNPVVQAGDPFASTSILASSRQSSITDPNASKDRSGVS
jgi:signal transduction histidine kinase